MHVLLVARNCRFVILFGLILMLVVPGAAPVYAESRVYKCTGASGQVTFTQTGCKRGIGESMVVDNPEVGWINLQTVLSKFKAKSAKTIPKRPKRRRADTSKSERAQQQRCWRARKKVARIGRELKRGYKLSRGEELRYQRTEQEEYLALFCREKPH
ncbi:MAG: DUF4124 domain-containing protein [Gammaproteobacteria bacterium]|nr:DUF4124 domain-containing protein [Gammaproteobacteria bacterium]